MPKKPYYKKTVVLGKNQAFRAGGQIHGEIVGNRTKLNLGKLSRRYKLSKAYTDIRNLDFRSDREIKLQSFQGYQDYRSRWLARRFRVDGKSRPRYPTDEAYRNRKSLHIYTRGNLLVLIDSDVYNDIKDSIDQYVLDVGRDGYWATIHVVYGGTPGDIRNFITRRSCVGVLLVGAIPAPWFELADDFHNVHSEFPCDLYYMDTNGTWNDPDNDGKFDGHGGNLDPEIWVGRLWTPTANGNDATLLNDYFNRNHRYRLGLLGHARSALAYPDDDWQHFNDCALDEQFPSAVIDTYSDPIVTDADLYKSEVNSLRSWVQLCAHSSVHSHALRVGAINEHILVDYFRDVNPPNAHFYNLFCCGPGRYTENDYLAGWYIFDKPGRGRNNGLAAIASSKSGSMLLFEDFYRPMGQGDVIGDAYVNWWRSRGPDHQLWERRWFYGLVLLGDPTLAWWKGGVPKPEQPQNGDEFDHWPRKIQFRWDPINIPGAKYIIEVDAFGAISSGKWAEEINQTFALYPNVTANTLEHTFVGAQRGRWRVRAQVAGQLCSWSPWSYFRFTV